MKKDLFVPGFLILSFLLFNFVFVSSEILIEVDFESLPTGEVAGNTYPGEVGSVTLALSGGAEMDHVFSEGWQDSGAAKFYPPTVDDSYCGLGAPEVNGDYEQINIRFLIYFGSEFADSITGQIKSGIFRKSSEPRCWFNIDPADNWGGYQFTLGYYGTVAFGHGGEYSCGNYPCPYLDDPGGVLGTWPASYCAHCNDEFERCSNGCEIFYIADHLNEWIVVEMEATDSGRVSLYIWTADQSYDGMYLATNNSNPSSLMSIDKIIGYFNGGMVADSENYYIIDEVIVADEYIGFPVGFFEEVVECFDGVDNDGDGQVDLNDSGCVDVNDDDESDCGDGVCEGLAGEDNLTCVDDCFVGGGDCDVLNDSVYDKINCSYNGTACGEFSLCSLSCPVVPEEVCGNGVDEDCDGEDLVCGSFHDADLDEDGIVSVGELGDYIDRWLVGGVSIGEVMGAINVWSH